MLLWLSVWKNDMNILLSNCGRYIGHNPGDVGRLFQDGSHSSHAILNNAYFHLLHIFDGILVIDSDVKNISVLPGIKEELCCC